MCNAINNCHDVLGELTQRGSSLGTLDVRSGQSGCCLVLDSRFPVQWTINKHSQLEFGQRYNSGPFFVGGYPW